MRYLLLRRVNNYLNALNRHDIEYAGDDEGWALEILESWNASLPDYGLLDAKTGLVHLGYGWVEEDEPMEVISR